MSPRLVDAKHPLNTSETPSDSDDRPLEGVSSLTYLRSDFEWHFICVTKMLTSTHSLFILITLGMVVI